VFNICSPNLKSGIIGTPILSGKKGFIAFKKSTYSHNSVPEDVKLI